MGSEKVGVGSVAGQSSIGESDGQFVVAVPLCRPRAGVQPWQLHGDRQSADRSYSVADRHPLETP